MEKVSALLSSPKLLILRGVSVLTRFLAKRERGREEKVIIPSFLSDTEIWGGRQGLNSKVVRNTY